MFTPKLVASFGVFTVVSISKPASFHVLSPPFITRTSLTPAHLRAQFTLNPAGASLE